MRKREFSLLLLFLVFVMILTACNSLDAVLDVAMDSLDIQGDEGIEEDGNYTSKEEVALYIDRFGKLPGNYIKKSQAYDLGWKPKEGNLWEISDGKSIGGDRFGNREGNLPGKEGRQYYECDINYKGGYRGKERLVYSNDGLIYYTHDHYNSFELLYGDE